MEHRSAETICVKDESNNKYYVIDAETSEFITEITEDELIEVVAKRVLNKHLSAFKALADS